MKKFRKLVPAFAMLLVSATVLASTTFAWFSMNNKVTATGMEVTAKANTQYLIVGNSVGTDGKVVNAGTDKTTVAMAKPTGYGKANGADGIHVFPVSKVDNLDNIKDVTGNKIVNYTGTGTPIEVGHYFTANSPKYNSVTGDNNGISNVKKVDAAFADGTVDGKYFVKYTTYLGLADNSEAIANKTLTVKLLNENAGSAALDDSLRAVVVINGVAQTLDAGNLEVGADFTISIDNNAATNEGKSVAVSVFLYVDGYETNVKDDTAASLTGKLGLEFTVNLGA